MIQVTYYPTDSDATTSSTPTLQDWFVEQFGESMQVPKGLRITHGNASRESDVTDEIAMGDPNGHLTRTVGEYHVIIVPGVQFVVPIVVSLVISVAAVLLTPKPTVPDATNRRQDSPTNSLGARGNEPRPGSRYQDVRGFEPSVYADLLMEPHRRYEDNREIEYVYGTATTGRGLITNPRDGITPWGSIVGAKLDVYGPGKMPVTDEPDQIFGGTKIEFPIVSATRSRNVNGQILPPPNQLETKQLDFSADSTGRIYVTNAPEDFNFSNIYDAGSQITINGWTTWRYLGEQDYFDGTGGTDKYSAYDVVSLSGVYTILSVGTNELRVQPTANWNYLGNGSPLRTFSYLNVNNNSYYIDSDEPPGLEAQWARREYTPALEGIFDGTVGPFQIPKGSTSGWVNVLAPNGLRKAGRADYKFSVSLRFTLYELDENGIRTGNSEVVPIIRMESNERLITDQVGVTQDFEIPYEYCEISGRRVSNTDQNFEGTVIDEVKWAAMYTVEPTPEVSPQDVTTVYAEILQTPSALSVQERKLNFEVTRYERRYLGNGRMSAELDTPSAEFADAVVGLALDPYVGRDVTIEQLNIDSLYAVQEEIAEYFGTRDAIRFGYSFSTTDMTFEDHLTLIAEAVFCRVFRIGSTYEFRFNRPRSKGETALLLNHRLKYNGTDKRNRKFTDADRKGYDGVVVSYKDAQTKAFEEVRIPEGVFAVNPLEIEKPGVTNLQVAKWHALREWNRIKYQRIYHETQAHSLARGLVPGDRIIMANDTLTKSLNGQVLEQVGLNLRLANGIQLEDSVTYSITLLYKSGTVESILCTKSTLGDQWVQLGALPSEELYTGHLEWRTTYNLYEAINVDQDDMLVEKMKAEIKNGQERIKVQAINYDIRYWEGDPQGVSTGSFSTAFNDAFDKG